MHPANHNELDQTLGRLGGVEEAQAPEFDAVWKAAERQAHGQTVRRRRIVATSLTVVGLLVVSLTVWSVGLQQPPAPSSGDPLPATAEGAIDFQQLDLAVQRCVQPPIETWTSPTQFLVRLHNDSEVELPDTFRQLDLGPESS